MPESSPLKFDCLCAGIMVADHICAPISRLPQAGELIMTDRLSLTSGGCASNVAVDLARVGRRVGVIGRVGQDVFGEFVSRELSQAGVDTTHVLETPGVDTSGTLIVNVRGEDRRFIHAVGANASFDGHEVTPELIRNTKMLYLGGFCLMPSLTGESAARMFRIAREAGVPTVLDVVISDSQSGWEQLTAVLPFTDVFLPNSDEALHLTGVTDPFEQADRFCAAGAKTVVITCGRTGAVLVSGEQRLRSGAFAVEFIDGTGSGDAFAAGFIHGLLQQKPLRDCLEIGSALGASCVRHAGATAGVFNPPELEAFLQQQRLPVEVLGG